MIVAQAKKRILLLEDEESVSRGISFTLEKEGYAVVSCESVAQACRTFDVFDPAADDLQTSLCRTARAGSGPVRPGAAACAYHLPDALDGEIDQVMGYESGARRLCHETFQPFRADIEIRAFFSRQEGNFADIAEYGKLKIDLTSMKIWNGEDEISLTKNEWKLLRLFLQNPGQVLSKNQILEYALDTEVNFSDENTVAVNIRRLRSKIEEDSSRPKYIKNIRGLGYVWDSSNSTEGGRER